MITTTPAESPEIIAAHMLGMSDNENKNTNDSTLTREQEAELAARIETDESAAWTLAESVRGWVVTRVAHFMASAEMHRDGVITNDDLIAASLLMLATKAHRFDPTRARFITWANRIITLAIRMEVVNAGHVIRIPRDVTNELSRQAGVIDDAVDDELEQMLNEAEPAEDTATENMARRVALATAAMNLESTESEDAAAVPAPAPTPDELAETADVLRAAATGATARMTPGQVEVFLNRTIAELIGRPVMSGKDLAARLSVDVSRIPRLEAAARKRAQAWAIEQGFAPAGYGQKDFA